MAWTSGPPQEPRNGNEGLCHSHFLMPSDPKPIPWGIFGEPLCAGRATLGSRLPFPQPS